MTAKSYINAQISCEGIMVEISSQDLTFDELEVRLFAILAKLPINNENKTMDVNLR